MKISMLRWAAMIAVVTFMSAVPADAAKRLKKKSQGEQVELFAAIKSGDVEVQYIPASAKRANVIFKNKTKKPLSIKLPEAFGGVPVLAQGFGGGGFGGGGQGGGGFGGGGQGGGGGQQQGGGFGGGGGGGGFGGGGGGFGGGGQGGGGGFFDIAPEKVRKIKVNCVCLEHGKKDPNPRMKYKIVPIESVTKKQEVIELCKMLGSGKLNQKAAQAATWHYTDSMSWQKLANKVGAVHLNGSKEPFFQRGELQLGFRLAGMAKQRAEYVARQKKKSESSKSESLSSQ